MNHPQATHPGLRHELRGYLVRYRHLQPLVVATVALDELETALDLLQQVSGHLPQGGDEEQRLRAFLAPRVVSPGHLR
jgi:hypothetical protein